MELGFKSRWERLRKILSSRFFNRPTLTVAEELLGWDACTLDLYLPEREAVRPILMMETVLGKQVDLPFASRTHHLTARMRQCIQDGGQLILPEALESADPVVEPDAQPHIGTGEGVLLAGHL